MGCGASSSADLRAAAPSTAQQERTLFAASAADLHSLLSSPDHASSLIVGVFGLRGCGKSTMLHGVRTHLGGFGSVSSSQLPLPPPTDRFEVFLGPIASESNGADQQPEVLCVDTPGLPCAPSVRDAFSTLLPRVHRLLWVVDASSEWSVDASLTELSKLWRQCGAHAAEHAGAFAAAASSSSLTSSHLASPTLHVILLQRSPADASALTLADLSRRLRLLPEFASEDWAHRLRAWSAEWDANRKEAVIRAVLGSTPTGASPIAGASPVPNAAAAAAAASSSPSSVAPVVWATRRVSGDGVLCPPPPLMLPSDGVRPLTAEPPSGTLTSPSGVHLLQAR